MNTDSSLSARAAEEVRALLARRNINKSELARRLGVSHTWVTNRLTGAQEISLNDLQRIAEVLVVPFYDLLPKTAGSVTNGSSATLVPEVAESMIAPHPVDPRRDVGHPHHRRTGRTGRSLQRAIGHSPAVAVARP